MMDLSWGGWIGIASISFHLWIGLRLFRLFCDSSVLDPTGAVPIEIFPT